MNIQKTKSKNSKLLLKEEEWRKEIVHINEALQYLTRKKDKTQSLSSKWKMQTHQSALLSKTLNALALNPGQEKNGQFKPKSESKQAQELALEIAGSIDDIGDDKNKKQNGSVHLNRYSFKKELPRYMVWGTK